MIALRERPAKAPAPADVEVEVEVTFGPDVPDGDRLAAAGAIQAAFGRHIATRGWRPLPHGYTFTAIFPSCIASLVPPTLARARLAAQREVPSATMRLRNVDPRVAEVA